MVMLLADRLASTVAPASAAVRAGRDRHPEVLADLGMDDEARHVLGREQQVGAERRGLARRAAISPPSVPSPEAKWRLLVELAVVRQVDLRHDAEQPAAMDRQRAVVEPVAHGAAARRPAAAATARPSLGDHLGDRFLDRVEQRVLQQQVVDRVAGQRQLGKHRQAPPTARRRSRATRRMASALAAGSAMLHRGGAGGDPREAVTVEGAEGHGIFRNSGTGRILRAQQSSG